MEPGWLDLLKLWGPLAFGWPIAYMLGKELLTIMREERAVAKARIEADLKMAASIDRLSNLIEQRVVKNAP